MKKKLMALLMAMVLVLGMSTTVLAADSSYVNNTPPEVQELKVTWSETKAWTVDVQNVAVGENLVEYSIEIFKDGKYVDRKYCGRYAGEAVSFDISNQVAVNGPGKYTVEVDACANGFLLYEGTSAERTYTKPSTQLAAPTNFAYNLENDMLVFDRVENAYAYQVVVWEVYGSCEERGILAYLLDENISNGKVECQLGGFAEYVKYLKEDCANEDIKITFGVVAISEDIDKVACSEYAKCVAYENKITKEQAKEKFDEAFENVEEDPAPAVEALREVSNDTITEMLKTDAEFVAKVEKLDELLAEDLGDGLKGASSTTEAIDASKVKVVGMAINAASLGATTAELKIKDVSAAEKVAVPSGYAEGVQLDISFFADDRSVENLAVPMSITTAIPTGVETKDLVILHYHGDAVEPAVIVPTVNADGTMTFIVDGFSTFVVTNQVVTTTAPVTGDTSTTAFVCSLLLLVAGVVLMKRNAFAK